MKFDRLEAVRGFAAFYVCLGHLLIGKHSFAGFEFLLKFGQEAVMVFFVLSGFVVYWSSAKTSTLERTDRYYVKRFIRIYSVWALAVIALFVMASLEAGEMVFPSPYTFVGNMLMLQDFSMAKPAVVCQPLYGDTPLWSLHYEWWFYMIFPVTFLVQRPEIRAHAVGAAALAGSLTYVIVPNPISRLLVYFAVWWVGAHAATCLRKNGKLSIGDLLVPLSYVILASIPLLVLCVVYHLNAKRLVLGVHPVLEVRHLLSAVALVLVAFAWRRYHWVGFSWTMGRFTVLAPISFSLYVIHHNSIAHAHYFQFLRSPSLEFVLYLTVTLGFCCFSELLFYPWLRRRVFPGAVL